MWYRNNLCHQLLQDDKTFRLDRVLRELADVEQWKDLVFHLGVSKHVTDYIEKTYSGAAAQKREAISWWIENDNTASWRKVADALLKAGYHLLGTRLMLSKGKSCSFNLMLL